MELILNEKSLEGQFTDLGAFLETLPEMSKNLEILRKLEIGVWKHSCLYGRKVTGNLTLYDLNNKQGMIPAVHRDKVRKWKRELSWLTVSPPFWDAESEIGENGAQAEISGAEESVSYLPCRDSIEEAARRRTDVLSFRHTDYLDRKLQVTYGGQNIPVKSVVTTEFLMELLKQHEVVDALFYLQNRFGTGRVAFDYLKEGAQSVNALQKAEFEEAMEALKRFDTAESWEHILQDRFFCYKSYKPASRKKDYFAATDFADKKIDKFRCGQHSQVRCFGFREKDKFYVLLFERDHSLSDDG